MRELIKRLFLPCEENKFCPYLLGAKALVFYSILSVFLFLFNYPACQVKISRFLANLTQEAVIQQLNPIREDGGFLGLRVNSKLAQAAQMKAEDMINRGYFSHVGPDGEEPWSWFERIGYDYAAAGENLAVNFFDSKTLIDAWLASPTHAKNLLNGYFTDVGVGIARGEMEGKGDSTIVVMFLGREIAPEIQPAVVLGSAATYVPPQDSIKVTPPEKPVVKKTVSDNILEKKTVIKESSKDNIQRIERDYARSANSKIFLANVLTYEFRLALTLFFIILMVWASIILSIYKEKLLPVRLLRPFLLAFLIVIIWLPNWM